MEVHAEVDPDAPTGVFFKERLGPQFVNVRYYRSGPAASRLRPKDVPKGVVRDARLFHFTGISLAHRGTLRDATLHAVQLAREAGVQVTFDPNLRPQLWSTDEARRHLNPVIRDLDILLTEETEIQVLTGHRDTRRILANLRRRSVRITVIKRGPAGALVASDDRTIAIPAMAVAAVVDSVGAGDGFNAGFVAGHLNGLDIADCGRLGTAVGAAVVTGTGDYETVPAWSEARRMAASIAAHETELPA